MNCAIARETRRGARALNEDRIGCWSTAECLLMAVADGLGGHLHGELAAEAAVDSLGAQFEREARPRIADPASFLTRSIGAAHADILRAARERGLFESPRTVIVACLVQDGAACWTYAGDCRLYLLRHDRIVHRTRDHTVVQQLVDSGRLREEAAGGFPGRNYILQCLGGLQEPRPEPPASAKLEKDDVVLLCSDGLWAPLAQQEIAFAFRTWALDVASANLASLAEQRAGRQCDNISVLAMRWQEAEVAA